MEQIVPKKGNIIDLACGWGIFANVLALTSPDRNVYGIDLDERKIGWAQKTIGDRTNIRFECINLDNIQLPDVDAIIIYDALHHLKSSTQHEIIKECHRVLRPDGLLIVKENDVYPFWKLMVAKFFEMVALKFNITKSSKILFRSRDDWARMLGDYGFEVIHNEHLKTKYAFFVPHALLVGKKQS